MGLTGSLEAVCAAGTRRLQSVVAKTMSLSGAILESGSGGCFRSIKIVSKPSQACLTAETSKTESSPLGSRRGQRFRRFRNERQNGASFEIDIDPRGLLERQIVVQVYCLHRTGRDTGTAIDAYAAVDVEHPVIAMEAGHRTDLYTFSESA
ncbi:MAG: hypothetical protein HYU73_16105 [Betaproteobacteria bacterium]|nr:hypothetical protein [Betaproteobacteria bacterium]